MKKEFSLEEKMSAIGFVFQGESARSVSLRSLEDYTDTQIKEMIAFKGITFVDRPLYLFSEHEKKQTLKYWKDHEREHLDKIMIREVYSGPIEIKGE